MQGVRIGRPVFFVQVRRPHSASVIFAHMTTDAKHPKGLPYLFFSEMWERFGYYLMIGILLLYMKDTEKGGMSMDNAQASDIFGTFIALVFLTPFIGGLLADRVLGYRLSITIGGLLMAVGYMGLALDGQTAFYASLGLIILGNGFFKPNISTLLGNLYNTDALKAKKDAGYNIFYMGINLGAFICNFFAAYLRNTYGWGHAFVAAGIGMLLGIIIFWLGSKHYREADVRKPVKKEDMSLGRIASVILLPAVLAGYLGWIIPGNIFGSDSTDAFIFGALPVVGFYALLFFRSDEEDRKPIGALLSIMAVAVVFWAIFKQNGTALTVWAENYTDREVPTVFEPITESMRMTQHLRMEKSMYPVTDAHFRTVRDEAGQIVKTERYPLYMQNLTPQPEEGKELVLVSTEIFQSINPFFIIILTPIVVWLFAALRRRKKEPNTASKILWGLVITAISCLFMVGAVYTSQNGLEKSSAWWLVGTYGVITLGELCLSPMGLSLVSKLSPPRLTSLLMGGWFLSTSIGNKLSGVLASMWDRYEQKAGFFVVNCILVLAATILMALMIRRLSRVLRTHGA